MLIALFRLILFIFYYYLYLAILSIFYTATDDESQSTLHAGRIRLSQFNVVSVLTHAQSLLGSHGTEYDLHDKIGACTLYAYFFIYS